ncbi:MAG: acyl-CoA dehydrogenase family protein [Desulfobacteraceae bacterium]|nr:acyl-CoA dehydrogenase family protein [Desulfobacteraceae bacterium]
MNFAITNEQQMILEMVRKMVQQKILPRAAQIDDEGVYPEDIFQLLREQGLFGMAIPKEYGGSGTDILTFCLVLEEIAKACYNTAYILVMTYVPESCILEAGNETQKQFYLKKLASGEYRGAFATTEPGAGSDLGGIRTRAIHKDQYYTLNGRKSFITNSTVANFIIVFAKTDPDAGTSGLSAFIVNKETQGLSIGKIENKMGGKGVPSAEVILEDCKVPEENLLGEENKGFQIAMRSFNRSRPIIGARAVGLAQGALDVAINYAKQREAFGKTIASFQGIQFMIADMAMQIEASRQLVYKAVSLLDRGEQGKHVTGIISMAKCFSTDVAMRVAIDAAQILGAYGYIKDFPSERYIRDAKSMQIVEGTNQIQRVIIANALLN